MSDPLRPVGPGQSIGRLRDADTINALLESARWYRTNGDAASLARGVPLPASEITSQGRTEVLIESPAAIDNYGVVELGGAYLDAVANPARANNLPIFTAIAPTAAPAVVAVLTQPATATGKFVRACINGVCVARINVTNTSHRFAVTATGDTDKLVSAASGRIRILDTPAVTGTNTYVVQVLNDAEVSASSLTTYTKSYIVGTDTTNFVADNVWYDIGAAGLVVPVGTYSIIGYANYYGVLTAMGSSIPTPAGAVMLRLSRDASVPISTSAVAVSVPLANVSCFGSATAACIQTFASSVTLRLQGLRNTATGQTWLFSGTANPANNEIGFIKAIKIG